MLLTTQDVNLFFKLHRTLMFYVNERLKVLPEQLDSPEELAEQLPEKCLKVRDAWVEESDLIEPFVNDNPFGFAEDELEIVRSWRHRIAGTFYIFRQLKKYAVFLSSGNPPIAYGVTALTRPCEDLVGPHLPVMTKAVLLPFKGQIIYDGMLVSPGVSLSFGPGIRRMLNESYQRAKDYGIVTSLPLSRERSSATPAIPRPTNRKKEPIMAKKAKTPNPFTGRWRIVSMDQWDQEYIDEEEEGYFQFTDEGGGEFHFGYVHGQMECRQTTRDGEPAIEWTWDGNDEMDAAHGRGWAVVKGDELHGMIFFHDGDDSGFVAKKVAPKSTTAPKSKRARR